MAKLTKEEMLENSRLKRLFPDPIIRKLCHVIYDAPYDNNEKADVIMGIIRKTGAVFLGAGTNRLAVLIDGFVFKIAFDCYGVRDNWTEFHMSPELEDYVTCTYECNGVVLSADYVTPMTQEQFIASRPQIAELLKRLSKNYMFCDMSLNVKNTVNFGYRDDGTSVVLDYGYIYRKDPMIMFCKICGHEIVWNSDYSLLKCVKCGQLHNPVDIRNRMELPEDSPVFKVRRKLFTEDGKPKVMKLKLGI